jgi:ribonuclease P protein component
VTPRRTGPCRTGGAERLTKARRLLKRSDFLRVQKQSTSAHGRWFVLLAHRRGDEVALDGARLGIVASRKVGSAVARNRAKRLVREWFRKASVPDPVDLVVILKPGAADAAFSAICQELDQALDRVTRHATRGARRQRG